MSSWVDLDDHVVELADSIGRRLGLQREMVIEMGLIALDIRLWRQRLEEEDPNGKK